MKMFSITKSRKNLFSKNEGFSLIELMVVVAIIGILSAIGIPQYAKFQAKARQSEAKGALSSLFAAETSFMSEWNQYTKDLKIAGFGVSGTKLRYFTGFTPTAGAGLVGCLNYTITNGAPGEFGQANNTSQAVYQGAIDALAIIATMPYTYSCGANVNVASPTQAQAWQLPTGIAVAANVCTAVAAAFALPNASTASNCVATVGTQAFTAYSVGDPNSNVAAAGTDGWTIDNTKKVSNTAPGIL